MAQKRTSDALVAMPDMKRARNELVAITNRDKALLEAVSKSFVCISSNSCFLLFKLNFKWNICRV